MSTYKVKKYYKKKFKSIVKGKKYKIYATVYKYKFGFLVDIQEKAIDINKRVRLTYTRRPESETLVTDKKNAKLLVEMLNGTDFYKY